MTYAFMAALLGLYAAAELYGAELSDPQDRGFFEKQDVDILKGAFCIIIVLVHAPKGYGNRIQDVISSFGYIGVTFFFMASAYGLCYGVKQKKGYIRSFWLRRLPGLLIPVFLVNLVTCAVPLVTDRELILSTLIVIPNWVQVLLLCYAVFWTVHAVSERLGWLPSRRQSLLIGFIVAVLSVIGMFSPWKIMYLWPVEAWGFLFGLFAAEYRTELRQWLDTRWAWKCGAAAVTSVIIGVSYLKWKQIPFWGDYLLRIMLSAVLILLLLLVLRRVRLGNWASRMLGNISYFVYLSHGFVYRMMEKSSIHNSGLFLLLSILAACVLSGALWYVNSRIVKRLRAR